MGTIIGSGRDCVLIILFQLYGCKVGLFQGDLFWGGGVSMTPNFHIGTKLIQY